MIYLPSSYSGLRTFDPLLSQYMLNALNSLPAKLTPANGLLARGKALAAFYKSGIVNVWHNRKVGQNIRAQYGAKSAFDLARAITENRHLIEIENGSKSPQAHTSSADAPRTSSLYDTSLSSKYIRGSVTRSEFLTMLRTERDLKKIPLFAVIFAVFFECTPLVLWVFPQIAPSTCWSKSYIMKLRDNYSNDLVRLRKTGFRLNGSESVFRLSSAQLRQLSQTLGLVKSSHAFPLVFLYPLSMLRSRLQKHLITVRADDIFLRQYETSLEKLDPEELKRALMARALPLDGGTESIRRWLEDFKEPMDAGFFFMSS